MCQELDIKRLIPSQSKAICMYLPNSVGQGQQIGLNVIFSVLNGNVFINHCPFDTTDVWAGLVPDWIDPL